MDLICMTGKKLCYNFQLDQYTCYRCKTGNCSLNETSLLELYKSTDTFNSKSRDESESDYCKILASNMLRGNFYTKMTIVLFTECGHYDCDDGRHRICIASKLAEKGAILKLPVQVLESEGECSYCSAKRDLNTRYDNLSILDTLFKTPKYRKLIEKMHKLDEEYEWQIF